jgi:small subunit ribosomal protein S6
MNAMALYEHVVVSRPDISPQQVDALVEDITRMVVDREGKVGRTEYWGLRNLAYPIKKSRKAHYSLLNIECSGDVIHEVERRHRINEDVLRFLTVRVEAFSDDVSPVIARKDRDDRRKPRREGEGGGPDEGFRRERGDREGGFGGRDRDRGERDGGGFGRDRGGRGRED